MISEQTQAVLFDLDGTLIDTAPTFAKVLNMQLEAHGKNILPFERIRARVSHGARALITLGFGLEEEDEGFEDLRLELLDIYETHIDEGSELFPGMDKVLLEIDKKHIPWGIVTNKPSRFTFPLIDKLGINERCSVVVCPDDVTHTKPDPEPMALAAFRLNVKADQCMYVGDHERDIAAGNAIGMHTVAAHYGYLDKDDEPSSWDADQHINTPLELIKN